MTGNPVHAWLLALCDPRAAETLPSRRLGLDRFARLLELAAEHGVAPAVCTNLDRLLAEEGVERMLAPAAREETEAARRLLAAAKQDWLRLVAATLNLRQATERLLARFAAAGLRCAVVKGEDFADRLYPLPSLRPFRDIDLLLPEDDFAATEPPMHELGFAKVRSGDRHDSGYGEQTWDSLQPPKVRVDVHWNLINSPAQRRGSSLRFHDLQWETCPRTGRHRATPASLLLLAAVHAVLGHRFDRLQQLCDMVETCRGAAGPIDHDWLREAAGRAGVVSSLAGALVVTAHLLREPAVESLLHGLRLPGPRLPWRLLVDRGTLLEPYTGMHKLRRTLVREWMKRAA